MELHRLAHGLVADLLRASPQRPKRKARTWARHQMVAAALPELERCQGRAAQADRQNPALAAARAWLEAHGDEMPPAGYQVPGWKF